jgi:hypothetical protein
VADRFRRSSLLQFALNFPRGSLLCCLSTRLRHREQLTSSTNLSGLAIALSGRRDQVTSIRRNSTSAVSAPVSFASPVGNSGSCASSATVPGLRAQEPAQIEHAQAARGQPRPDRDDRRQFPFAGALPLFLLVVGSKAKDHKRALLNQALVYALIER